MNASMLVRRLSRWISLGLVALLAVGTSPRLANAACGCPSGGVPNIRSVKLKGNDLDRVRGDCAPARALVELEVYQQHLSRENVCPPKCPQDAILTYCINQCEWIPVGRTTANSAGQFTFSNLDSSQSVQLIATLPNQPNGLDGVYTALRVRTRDPATGQWSEWTQPPTLEAFNFSWPLWEGSFAYTEMRVSNADHAHIAVADGPDDGDQPSIALDVDEDTADFWLRRNPGGTVEWIRYGHCDVYQGCPSTWYVAQSPSVTVQSPPLGRGSEYPFVLGMVTASRPGAMFVGTNILGPRNIPDVNISVDVDVDIDLDLGIDFISIF